jgi:hypothetical protein
VVDTATSARNSRPAGAALERLLAAGAALVAAALAVGLAWHHPLSPLLALLGCTLTAAVAGARPAQWPLLVLPLLPLIGFMPWTGWILVEELDLLLLSVAAGAYARWALAWPVPEAGVVLPAARPRRMRRGAVLAGALSIAWLWLLPVLLMTAVGLARGMADAGPLVWGWWQGYREPLNGLRLAKPVLAMALLLPLWMRALRRQPQAAERALALGMAGLLATTAWGVFWERWAYTGLLNFSSDYRAVGLFWEMHVGGAALDAALVMGLPFAGAALLAARLPRHWVPAAVVAALGAYAALTTFSRIVYLAAPLAVGLWWWLDTRRRGQSPASLTAAVLGWLGVVGLAAWLFGSGGYRSMLALLGAVALLLPLADVVRPLPARAWGLGLLGGLLGSAAVAALSLTVPKGPYLAYTAAWVATAAALLLVRRSGAATGTGAVLLAGWLSVLAGLVSVGVGWGGPTAWPAGLVSAGVLAAVLVVACGRRRPGWPGSWRWQGTLFALMVLGTGVVGVFGGGAYMVDRFTSTSTDTELRQGHVRKVLSWLSGTDWWLGKGMGRFVDHYAYSGRAQDQVGDYRLAAPGQGGSAQALALASGKHTQGWGEIFRVSQRVAVPAAGPLKVVLQVNTTEAVEMHADICEKHLLYTDSCRSRALGVKPQAAGWQQVELPLGEHGLSRGSWWAPRWIVFSVAVGSSGHKVQVDGISLRDASGAELLANGGFEQGMARWFFSSDRHHMPWHAKNLALHLLFEQGLLGLAAWSAAFGVALWRLVGGAARGHALAPPLAGALLGAAVVGLVDSLLDMPRIGWLMGLLLAAALTLPGGRPAPPSPDPGA